MSECITKLYVDKDFDFKYKIEDDAGFDFTDIQDITFTLVNTKNPGLSASYKKSLGQVDVISNDEILVHGKAGDVLVAGNYEIFIDLLNTSNGEYGPSSCPLYVRFYSRPI